MRNSEQNKGNQDTFRYSYKEDGIGHIRGKGILSTMLEGKVGGGKRRDYSDRCKRRGYNGIKETGAIGDNAIYRILCDNTSVYKSW